MTLLNDMRKSFDIVHKHRLKNLSTQFNVHASTNTEYIMSELMSFQCTYIKCPNSSIVF